MPTPLARLQRLQDQLETLEDLYSRMVRDNQASDQVSAIETQIVTLRKQITDLRIILHLINPNQGEN